MQEYNVPAMPGDGRAAGKCKKDNELGEPPTAAATELACGLLRDRGRSRSAVRRGWSFLALSIFTRNDPSGI